MVHIQKKKGSATTQTLNLNAFSDVLQKLLDLFPGEAQIADASFARRK